MKLNVLVICSLSLLGSISAAEGSKVISVRYGEATYKFEDRRFAPIFQNVLVFGHSLSADAWKPIISLADGPGTVLARAYAGSDVVGNISEPRELISHFQTTSDEPLDNLQERLDMDPKICERATMANRPSVDRRLCKELAEETFIEKTKRGWNRMMSTRLVLESGLTKMYRWLEQTSDDSTLPSRQLSVLNDLYSKASVLVGIDAFYLTATTEFEDECHPFLVQSILDRFTQKVFNDGKVMILGNVPREDRSSFSYVSQIAVFPQSEICRQTVNKNLDKFCTPDRNCYLVSVEALVERLNSTGHLYLKDGTKLDKNLKVVAGGRGGNSKRSYVVRPDGVNLSDRGVQVIVENILSLLNANPPQSAENNFSSPL